MKKDVKIALILKDINELQLLTKGLDEMNSIPEQYLDLAIAKSLSLYENLQQLGNILKDVDVAGELDKSKDNSECLEAERCAENARRAEEARLAEEARKAEEARIAAEKAEAERLEAERLEAERRAEEERLEAERLEKERQEKERLEAERIEKERIEAERRAEAERLEAERIAKEKAAEEARRAEEARIAEEAVIPQAQVTTVADTIHSQESVKDAIARETDSNTIANSLGNKKISDLKSAITIADRFLFQRELFGGDGELLNKTIATLNAMTSIEEARDYINSHFDWNNERAAVVNFMKILERRF